MRLYHIIIDTEPPTMMMPGLLVRISHGVEEPRACCPRGHVEAAHAVGRGEGEEEAIDESAVARKAKAKEGTRTRGGNPERIASPALGEAAIRGGFDSGGGDPPTRIARPPSRPATQIHASRIHHLGSKQASKLRCVLN